jgi:hypothetical protein
MKGLISSLPIGVCLLALSAGVAFADNLHNPSINGTPSGTPTLKGQTGTGSTPTVSGCSGGTSIDSTFKPNNGALGQTGSAALTVAIGSPFNQATGSGKAYAGAGVGSSNPKANSQSNPKANSQYDNACSQATLH